MKRFHRILCLAVAMIAVQSVLAAIPSGYYSSINGKSESELKTALYTIISNHQKVSSYNALPSYFEKTDVYPNTTRWWDMYSDVPIYLPWSGTLLNREHCLPKSWWGGNTSTPAYVDLFHLYPAEAQANQKKSNYPLGVVTGDPYYSNNFVKVGTGVNSGGAKYVFEPNDEYKGDFARTYFYMVTCYQTMNWTTEWQVRNGVYPSLQQWAIDLLLQWHRQDGVSQKEIDRNEQVYKVQSNRNPFIDHPELVEYIWGNRKGEPYTGDNTPAPQPGTLQSPVNNMDLDFTQTAVGHPVTSQLLFKGTGLTGRLELAVIKPTSGTGNQFFTLSTSSVQASAANAESGTWITVTYAPTEVGVHSARLSITEGGLDEGSRVVNLIGEALPVPTLSTPVAISPADVTADSYVARWEAPAEPVDYYVVTLKRYGNGAPVTSELVAEADSLVIDGFADYAYDTYAVQSVRLNIRSQMSNVITVANAAIGDILVDAPFTVESFPGLIRVRCSEPHTNLQVIDVYGRLLLTIPTIGDGQSIDLPAGVYLLRTDQCRRPVKVVAY